MFPTQYWYYVPFRPLLMSHCPYLFILFIIPQLEYEWMPDKLFFIINYYLRLFILFIPLSYLCVSESESIASPSRQVVCFYYSLLLLFILFIPLSFLIIRLVYYSLAWGRAKAWHLHQARTVFGAPGKRVHLWAWRLPVAPTLITEAPLLCSVEGECAVYLFFVYLSLFPANRSFHLFAVLLV